MLVDPYECTHCYRPVYMLAALQMCKSDAVALYSDMTLDLFTAFMSHYSGKTQHHM